MTRVRSSVQGKSSKSILIPMQVPQLSGAQLNMTFTSGDFSSTSGRIIVRRSQPIKLLIIRFGIKDFRSSDRICILSGSLFKWMSRRATPGHPWFERSSIFSSEVHYPVVLNSTVGYGCPVIQLNAKEMRQNRDC